MSSNMFGYESVGTEEDPAAKSGRYRRPAASSGDGMAGFWVGLGVITLLVLIALGFGVGGFILAFTHEHDDADELDGQYCSECCLIDETLVHMEFSGDDETVCFDPENPNCAFTLFPMGFGDWADDASDVYFDSGNLYIESLPFTSTVPSSGSGPDPFGGLDHVKFLAYLGEDGVFVGFPTAKEDACDATELVYSARVSCYVDLNLANISSLYASGIEFPEEDYRLGACGINSIAFQEFNNAVGLGAWQVADFFLTNERVFIINERLPFGRPSAGGTLNEYASYTEVIPVARRTPDQFHKVAIAYNKASGTIRYLLDDQEVYRVTRPGMRPELCDLALYHGGDDELIFPENVSFGFGTFTILDAFHWNWGQCNANIPLARLVSGSSFYLNPFDRILGEPQPVSSFYAEYPTVEDRIWGQGAALSIDWIDVSYQQCGCTN